MGTSASDYVDYVDYVDISFGLIPQTSFYEA